MFRHTKCLSPNPMRCVDRRDCSYPTCKPCSCGDTPADARIAGPTSLQRHVGPGEAVAVHRRCATDFRSIPRFNKSRSPLLPRRSAVLARLAGASRARHLRMARLQVPRREPGRRAKAERLGGRRGSSFSLRSVPGPRLILSSSPYSVSSCALSRPKRPASALPPTSAGSSSLRSRPKQRPSTRRRCTSTPSRPAARTRTTCRASVSRDRIGTKCPGPDTTASGRFLSCSRERRGIRATWASSTLRTCSKGSCRPASTPKSRCVARPALPGDVS